LAGVTRADLAVLQLVARLRTPAATSVARAVDHLGASAVSRFVAWATIAVLAGWRRFQHLIAYLAVLLAGSFVVTIVALRLARMRPAEVAIIGGWRGYANPSRPVAGLALVLSGVVYTLAPAGPWRRRATIAAGLALGGLCAARLYLAVDHPTDVFAGLAIGWALPALMYGWATPDEAFPVTYRRGRRAHLDIGGSRGVAIRRALDHQLGLSVESLEPFGLGGSAGSTPLRLRVRRGRDATGATVVFAKLYALSHLRSDRLYKLARSIRYGRLEDEKPFSSVRRLVEYEDHLLRLFSDLGMPVPKPEGFVEITPEREYLIVMEFFDGARELGGTAISDEEIDSGLAIVRAMWDAGVAHRDIKPSNVLVRDGQVLLIDMAFGEVRPSPWRQAVDLANMMMSLALASSAERVYARSQRFFSPDDVAEAFAASRGVTIPAQLKARLRADGGDLHARFRELAPSRAPVSIQRWTLRRLAATVGAAAAMVVLVWGASVYARAAGLL
jgi:tRNA A-37 threonylcarbamoyl transferase component Bud32